MGHWNLRINLRNERVNGLIWGRWKGMEKFYFSLAAGSQFKTARTLNYPYVLINHQSQTNQPPKYDYKSLFVDCGGFSSSFKHGGYTNSDEDYLEYVQRIKPDYFALRDYPCEQQLLIEHNWTVQDQQEKTLENHLKLLDLIRDYDLNDSTPVPVIQGWTIEDYLHCIDTYKENNLIKPYMAIGSVCRRNATKDIIKVILAVKNELKNVKLHGFGVKKTVLKDKATFEALYSVDSGAWDYEARWKKLRGELSGPEASIICGKRYAENINELMKFHKNQTELVIS